MPVFLNALACGILGAILAHIAYVQSNLLVLGDTIRHGRHPLFDPLAFDMLGLLWGLLIGGTCAVWLRAMPPWKPAVVGIAVTLAGVALVGGALAASRYLELPVEPSLGRKDLVLEFEVRLPVGREPTGQSHVRTTMGSGT